MVPKLKFILCPIKETSWQVYEMITTSPMESSKRMFFDEYPKLEKKLKGITKKSEIKTIIYNFFDGEYKSKKKIIENKITDFQNNWDKINDSIMNVLSDINETVWPKKFKTVTVRITLNYICLCNLKKGYFDIFYKQDDKTMKETCIHELLHLIYCAKWMEVFPKTDEDTYFEYPHMAWHLLEIVPQIILNDKKIQDIFSNHFVSYEEFRAARINKKPLLSYIQDFYDKRKSFKEFLEKSYDFVKKHEKEVKI